MGNAFGGLGGTNINLLEYLASFVCHQAPERTLTIGSHFLPLCARCTGIYAGFLTGIIFQIITARRVNRIPSLGLSAISAILVFTLIIEGLGEKLQLWGLSNQGRLLVGLFGGSAISVTLFPLFNYFLQKDHTRKAAIALKDYILLLVLISFLFPSHYIPSSFLIFSFISVAGMLAMYLTANMTVAGMIIEWRKREPTLRNVSLMMGLVLALFVGEVVILRMVG